MNRNIWKDRRLPAVVLIVISLAGLGWVQYRMIYRYYNLSREKYDQRVVTTLSQMGEENYRRTLLSNLISAIVTRDTLSFPVGMDSLRSAGTHFLNMYITDKFRQAGLSDSFEFAVRDRISHQTYLSSKQYKAGSQWLGNYNIPFEGTISQDCRCAPYLNIRFNRLGAIIFDSLGSVLYAAIAFFLILLIGFYLLIRILREQQYLDRVKNEFINNLTHEIKTPVFSLSLATRLMKEKPDYDLGTYLTQVEKQVAHLKENVEKVLELASIENSQQLLQLQTVRLDTLVADTVRDFSLAHSQHLVSTSLEAGMAMVRIDPVHLKNALNNLLDNALKYGGPDKPVLILTSADSRMVKIIVRDQGKGIDKEHQEAVFEKFYRVKNGSQIAGFGLGLSYVKQVVQMMHGSVSLSSTPDQGSSFNIQLPLIR